MEKGGMLNSILQKDMEYSAVLKEVFCKKYPKIAYKVCKFFQVSVMDCSVYKIVDLCRYLVMENRGLFLEW